MVASLRRLVTVAGLDIDPYLHDPDRWGTSMAQSAEVMLPVLEAAGVRSIYEVGAFAGDLTRVLVAWAAKNDARVGAIDPFPQPGLVELAEERPELDLIRRTSADALPEIALPDAIVIDGDHNWHVVTEELRTIARRAGEERLPLLLFHDVNWPHARRDDYYDISQVPVELRQPLVGPGQGIHPDEPGTRPEGLPYQKSAAREGGPRNGVLTAIEDFVEEQGNLRLAVVPSWFGFGIVWQQDAPYAEQLEELLRFWDRNPLIARLERNRVLQLAERHARSVELWRANERLARQQEVLQRLLNSSAFRLAERLSKLRSRAGVAPEASVISREDVRRALETPPSL